MWWKVSIHLTRILFLIISFLVRGIYAVLKLYRNMIEVVEWEILKLNSCSVVFTLIFDWISLLFLCFVFLISRRVLYYRGRYIIGDKNFNRFIYLVLMFVFSIAAIVLSPNLIRILLGWDGLGLVSYVLVIYYQNEKSANAGMLTILSNRVGDVAILLRIGLIVKLGGWNFLYYVYNIEDGKWLGFKFLIILAVITKRAQIPFSAWLPAAIAAPTPVSALVHSSTLVTAGVYLIIRFSPVLSSYTQRSLLIISCLTIFIAGLGANFEYDLKKIIALSTLSQLGVILRILALGFSDLAFFHLLRHALFKALLFMCAGVFIHRRGEYQDIRYIGCLVKFIPYRVIYIRICNFALCGFPFLAGFYSKDIILEIALIRWVNLICLWIYILATGLTVAYTIRLVFYRIRGEFNLSVVRNSKDIRNLITDSIILLGLGAIIGGAGLSWLLFPEPYIICIRGIIKRLIITVRIIGGFIGYICNLLNVNYRLIRIKNYFWIVFIGSIWFIPFLRSVKNRDFIIKTRILIEKTGEKGWLEELGPQGLYWKFTYIFIGLNELQINNVKIFIKIFVLRILIILFIIICLYNL